MMGDIMNAGALGVEIIISGKIPGARAKRWRFYQGYLKKCGDVALGVKSAYTSAQMKSGSVGILVKIMPPDLILPDKITIGKKEEEGEESKPEEKEKKTEAKEEAAEKAEEGKGEETEEVKGEEPSTEKKKKRKKKSVKKAAKKEKKAKK
jgi:small subunit ribosomal protein S3